MAEYRDMSPAFGAYPRNRTRRGSPPCIPYSEKAEKAAKKVQLSRYFPAYLHVNLDVGYYSIRDPSLLEITNASTANPKCDTTDNYYASIRSNHKSIDMQLFGDWSPLLIRKFQDKFNFEIKHIRWLIHALEEKRVPLNRPVTMRDLRGLEDQMEPAILAELVGKVLKTGPTQSLNGFALVEYALGEYDIGGGEETEFEIEITGTQLPMDHSSVSDKIAQLEQLSSALPDSACQPARPLPNAYVPLTPSPPCTRSQNTTSLRDAFIPLTPTPPSVVDYCDTRLPPPCAQFVSSTVGLFQARCASQLEERFTDLRLIREIIASVDPPCPGVNNHPLVPKVDRYARVCAGKAYVALNLANCSRPILDALTAFIHDMVQEVWAEIRNYQMDMEFLPEPCWTNLIRKLIGSIRESWLNSALGGSCFWMRQIPPEIAWFMIASNPVLNIRRIRDLAAAPLDNPKAEMTDEVSRICAKDRARIAARIFQHLLDLDNAFSDEIMDAVRTDSFLDRWKDANALPPHVRPAYQFCLKFKQVFLTSTYVALPSGAISRQTRDRAVQTTEDFAQLCTQETLIDTRFRLGELSCNASQDVGIPPSFSGTLPVTACATQVRELVPRKHLETGENLVDPFSGKLLFEFNMSHLNDYQWHILPGPSCYRMAYLNPSYLSRSFLKPNFVPPFKEGVSEEACYLSPYVHAGGELSSHKLMIEQLTEERKQRMSLGEPVPENLEDEKKILTKVQRRLREAAKRATRSAAKRALKHTDILSSSSKPEIALGQNQLPHAKSSVDVAAKTVEKSKLPSDSDDKKISCASLPASVPRVTARPKPTMLSEKICVKQEVLEPNEVSKPPSSTRPGEAAAPALPGETVRRKAIVYRLQNNRKTAKLSVHSRISYPVPRYSKSRSRFSLAHSSRSSDRVQSRLGGTLGSSISRQSSRHDASRRGEVVAKEDGFTKGPRNSHPGPSEGPRNSNPGPSEGPRTCHLSPSDGSRNSHPGSSEVPRNSLPSVKRSDDGKNVDERHHEERKRRHEKSASRDRRASSRCKEDSRNRDRKTSSDRQHSRITHHSGDRERNVHSRDKINYRIDDGKRHPDVVRERSRHRDRDCSGQNDSRISRHSVDRGHRTSHYGDDNKTLDNGHETSRHKSRLSFDKDCLDRQHTERREELGDNLAADAESTYYLDTPSPLIVNYPVMSGNNLNTVPAVPGREFSWIMPSVNDVALDQLSMLGPFGYH